MDYLTQIRTVRECKDFSQDFMAEKLGLSVGGYGKLERGESKMSVDTLLEIAQILEIELSDLFLISGKAPIFANKNNHYSSIHSPIQQQHSNYYYIVGDEAIEKLSQENKHLNELLSEKLAFIQQQTEQIESLKEIIRLMKKEK